MDFQEIFERALLPDSQRFVGKTVLDLPAGGGRTTQLLKKLGAKVIAMDLFPSFYKWDDPTCQFCDLNDKIGLPDQSVDYVVSQEGFEHLPHQLQSMKEFSRVLRPGGRLILTTPNNSNMTAKLSYLLNESEKFGRLMPPNVVDSLWCNSGESRNIYFGHLFLIGICHLNVLAEVAGFKLTKVYFTKLQVSCVIPFLIFYPFIFLFQLKNVLRNTRKKPTAKSEYWKAFWLSVNPKILLDGGLMVEFTKEKTPAEAQEHLYAHWHKIQKNEP